MAQLRQCGADTVAVEADPANPTVPAQIFDRVESTLGGVTALILAYRESVAPGILDTTID